MPLIKCKECGNLISDKARQCPKCGAFMMGMSSILRVSQQTTGQRVSSDDTINMEASSVMIREKTSPSLSGNSYNGSNTDSPRKSNKGIIIGLCTVLFLLLAGVVFLLIKNNQDERETERKLAEMTAQHEKKAKELELASNELEAEKLKLEAKTKAENAAKAEKARQEKAKREKEAEERRKEEAGPKMFEVDGVQFTMVYVAGGTFNMGATSDQSAYADADENPAHSVTLSGFFIGQTEVTQELWLTVMDSNPSDFYGSQRPVENVTWSDCQRFISKLNSKTGRHFRLPTEAEWEYAARGGKRSSHYKFAGSDYLDNVAWYYDNAYSSYDSSDYGTHNVATKSPNELGIYDMSGNVWELCQDWYGEGYYKRSPKTNPKGPSSGSYRVRRGGSWGSNDCYSNHCRVSNRGVFAPRNHFDGVGMRLAL